jgi:hypothetical protein
MGVAAIPVLAYASLATGVAGAGIAAYSAVQQGRAQSQAAQYQSAVARNNATMADYNAKVATQTGENEEAAKREQTAQTIGMERAAIGASGLDPNSGSPLRLQSDVARLGELDAATIRNNAMRTAYGFKTQGISYGAQAALDESQGRYATKAGNLGAFTSLISGASNVSSKWASFQQAGVFG